MEVPGNNTSLEYRTNTIEKSGTPLNLLLHSKSRILHTKLDVLATEIVARLGIWNRNLERIHGEKAGVEELLGQSTQLARYHLREHVASRPFQDGVARGYWDIAPRDGVEWPYAIIWIDAPSRPNSPERFSLRFHLQDYPAKGPTATLWDNRLYLYASNLGSSFAADLMTKKSNLWKGVILFSPMFLPELSTLHGKRVLIVGGTDDNWVPPGKLMDYQDQAAAAGIPIKLFFENHAGFIFVSVAAERRRAWQFAKFLAED